jgi:hypothetical protein
MLLKKRFLSAVVSIVNGISHISFGHYLRKHLSNGTYGSMESHRASYKSDSCPGPWSGIPWFQKR